MAKIISIEQTRQIEASADAHSISYTQMMDNAGYATARYAKYMLKDIKDKPRVTILIGGGNNGGDGLVAGKYLAEDSTIEVRFYLIRRLDEAFVPYQIILDSGLFVAYAEDDRDLRVLRHMVASADLVIDALLGIGARIPITGDMARILRMTKQALNERRTELASSLIIHPTYPNIFHKHYPPRILAVDCPSGVDCDTGDVDENTLHADATITFIAPKVGLLKYPCADFVGQLIIAPIDIPPNLPELQNINIVLVTAQITHQYLPKRPSQSNKGIFGKVLIIGGSANYIGAMSLCGLGAYRAGAGIVTIATPSPIISMLAPHVVEATWLPLAHHDGAISLEATSQISETIQNYDAALIGPGLGQSVVTSSFLQTLLSTQSLTRNLVIDADALNLLAQIDRWWEHLPEDTILTPHPGEMARLCGMSVQEIQDNRWELASQKAQEWGVILLLKGAHTVIASPGGKVYVLPFKNDALATAGTGDILAGIIVALLGQGASPFNATWTGAYIHGLAGEIAYAKHNDGRGVIATDILACIPSALGQIMQT